MHRRRVLRASLATLTGTALAGCSGIGDRDGDGARTVNPALETTPTDTPTATATPTPYGADASDALDQPRDLILGNRRLTAIRVRVRVTDGEQTVFDRAVRVPGAIQRRLSGVFGAARTYAVRVAAADGRDASFAWSATDDAGHLGVDLDAGISHFDAFDTERALSFVAESSGELVTEEGWSLRLLVDNPGSARRVTVAMADGDDPPSASIDVPSRSRLLLPLRVPQSPVRLVATVDGSDVEPVRWQPLVDGVLVLHLGERPRFLCDLLVRDLRVRNDRTTATTVGVVVEADGVDRFEDSVTLRGGSDTVARAVVPPATRYTFRLEYDGRTERIDWALCPPVGPVVVTRTDAGVSVTVRPLGPST
ncbi:hypothetical protein [Halobaculum limi]|uniref:hypothetical protein n=1 Tax=Halobaculum limi TaxID=3031916 RepID=UPI00240755EE|nr:hypothetical protein [Halobaculum sp. YSMS11]